MNYVTNRLQTLREAPVSQSQSRPSKVKEGKSVFSPHKRKKLITQPPGGEEEDEVIPTGKEIHNQHQEIHTKVTGRVLHVTGVEEHTPTQDHVQLLVRRAPSVAEGDILLGCADQECQEQEL